MDPFIGGALISGATSLLGGLFGRNQAKKDLRMQRQLINEQNEYNNPTNIRKRAEEGGFNPLSFIGPGVGLQTQTAQVNSGNYMGAAIADAGMAFAGAMADKAKFQETKKLNDLEMANAKLQNKILQLTLRPKVEGIYAQRQSTPTIAAAVGGGNAGQTSAVVAEPAVVGQDSGGSPSSVGAGLTYGLPKVSDRAWMTPGREAKVSPTENISGLMHVDNAITGPLTFFGADGEIFMEYVQAPILGAPQVALNWAGMGTEYIRRKFPTAGSYDPYHADPADIARMGDVVQRFNNAASKARPDLGEFYDRPNMRHTVRPAPPVLKAVVPKKPKKAYDPRPLFHQWGVYSSSPGSF